MSFFRFAVFYFLLFLPLAVFARNIEIVVEDDDLNMPLEGAVVSLRDGTRFVCGEDGMATVILPDDRQTVVQITYPGYETRRVTIPTASAATPSRITVSLRLGGVMESKELVVEARRPETSETQTGRSVAISERELARTAEIGMIEDVMSSVKLLPGVGYTGMFGALPSIRGGDPGDLVAAFDGFYLETPYHWMGAVSIFDPKMVSSARLSHGVFSARYGHSISGLLEITSKSPSFTEAELETAIGTSSASINLSYPLNGKGGILVMGKVSYWDLYIGLLKGISTLVPEDENLAQIKAVSTAPFIRSAAVAANYRFTPDLDWRLNAFFGSDGVGAASNVKYDGDSIKGNVDFSADYGNYQGFLISGITASPSPVLAIKATAGVGFTRRITDDIVKNDVTVRYNDDFISLFDDHFVTIDGVPFPVLISDLLRRKETFTAPDVDVSIKVDHTIFNAQVRGDLDWDLGKGFIAAFGVHELYSLWAQNQDISISLEFPLSQLSEHMDQLPPEIIDMLNDPEYLFINDIPRLSIFKPMKLNTELMNHGLTTSAYGLLEYKSPDQRFGFELGLRMDHLFMKGKGFSAYTMPALNPRLNLDFNILKNKGVIDSLDITVGTGLFSSVNMLMSFVDGDRVSMADTLKFNRSWTSIVGVRVDLDHGYSFNIEGYYKYVYDRAYIDADILSEPDVNAKFHFDGIGHVGGFDLQLQKLESRYIDGWISYTFTWAKYYDPNAGEVGMNQGSINGVSGWYFPSFHRFHNANIVLNIKPLRWFNISTRFGLASGRPVTKRELGPIYTYPVIYYNEENDEAELLQKYRRDILSRTPSRDPWSLPLDIKFTFFLFDRKGRVGTEIYLAAENLVAVFPFYPYRTDASIRFNEYTGKEDETGGIGSGAFDFPIPMISFGFKWRY